jgi:hypothetical protein
MNRNRWWMTATLACGLLAVALVPGAQSDEPRNEGPREKAAQARSEAVSQLALAQALATRGRQTKSPLELLTAAEILRRLGVPVEELKVEPKVEGKAGDTEARVEPPLSLAEEADVLLEDARSLASRQLKEGKLSEASAAAIESLAREIKSLKTTRGALGGPRRRAGFLHPGQSHTFTIEYNGYSMARVFVHSEGRSPLRVVVHNADGAVRAEDSGWNPSVGWMPARRPAVPFVIRVENIGNVGTPYRLVTN